MHIAEILKLVDEISQILVLTDPDAASAFEELPERFGDLGAVLAEMGHQEAADASRSAISISIQTLNGEADWTLGLGVLSATCEALENCLNEDCSPAEAGFPAELTEGLPIVESVDEAPVEVEVEVEAAPVPVEEVASEETPRSPTQLVDDAIVGDFLGRQADILSDVEEMLLDMEGGVSEEQESWLLRFFHTLKGESSLLGMADVADLCHATEDMMQQNDMVRCVDRLLEVKDWFIQYFRHYTEEGPEPQPLTDVLAFLAEPFPANSTPSDSTPAVVESPVVETVAEEPSQPVEAPPVTYDVPDYTSKNILEGDVDLMQDFIEEAVEHLDASEGHLLTIESDPQESEALAAVFRGFHTIKGLAGFIELDHVKDLAHKAENLLDMARRDELQLVGNNMDLVFESVDMMKRLVTAVGVAMGGDGVLPEEDELGPLIARLLVATSDEAVAAAAAAPEAKPVVEAAPEPVVEATPEPDPEPVADKPKPTSGFIPLGNMKKAKPKAQPVAEKAPAPAAAPAAVAAAPVAAASAVKPKAKTAPAPSSKAKAPVKVKEAVRVDAERLDHLVETIGELVIAESMVSQSPELMGTNLSVKLSKDLDHLDKICRELQEIGMSLRMVPVRPVFQKMARLVRDLSKKQERKVDFYMSGEDTELDKNVVDKIGDPLVHMVRNSVDHGIEPDSNDRIANGKPERGKVELRAFHKGGNICIEIEDDGRGLDRDVILDKAISRGLVREGEVLSDRDIFNMIFEAGFSTAAKVTEVSGRGVGMDVVRRNIEELRGTVDIHSEKGKGSTFSIKLPLTLAIIEGMVIMVGTEHYIIPTLSVVRLIRPNPDDITHVFDKGEMLAFEGNHLPLFRLGNLFEVDDAQYDPQEAMVVVVEEEGKQIGIMADTLLGQQSIVIKSLGEAVQNTDGVAGGAIMSDGNVALILDIAGLVRVAHYTDTTVVAAVPSTSAATVDHAVTPGIVDAQVEVSDFEKAVAEEAQTQAEIDTQNQEDQQPVTTGV